MCGDGIVPSWNLFHKKLEKFLPTPCKVGGAGDHMPSEPNSPLKSFPKAPSDQVRAERQITVLAGTTV